MYKQYKKKEEKETWGDFFAWYLLCVWIGFLIGFLFGRFVDDVLCGGELCFE